MSLASFCSLFIHDPVPAFSAAYWVFGPDFVCCTAICRVSLSTTLSLSQQPGSGRTSTEIFHICYSRSNKVATIVATLVHDLCVCKIVVKVKTKVRLSPRASSQRPKIHCDELFSRLRGSYAPGALHFPPYASPW